MALLPAQFRGELPIRRPGPNMTASMGMEAITRAALFSDTEWFRSKTGPAVLQVPA